MSNHNNKHQQSLVAPARINWRVAEFCSSHGIGKTTFYNEVKCGRLKIIKVGTRTLIPDREARAWQMSNELVEGI